MLLSIRIMSSNFWVSRTAQNLLLASLRPILILLESIKGRSFQPQQLLVQLSALPSLEGKTQQPIVSFGHTSALTLLLCLMYMTRGHLCYSPQITMQGCQRWHFLPKNIRWNMNHSQKYSWKKSVPTGDIILSPTVTWEICWSIQLKYIKKFFLIKYFILRKRPKRIFSCKLQSWKCTHFLQTPLRSWQSFGVQWQKLE